MNDANPNQQGYDLWSDSYDDYPNPTVAIDELCFSPHVNGIVNQRVLEIGCGTGRHTQKLARHNPLVVGVELSAGMLAKAEEKVTGEHVHFYNMDFLNGSIAHAPFDAIVMSLVLEHFPDLDRCFVKAADLLTCNGRLLFSEIHEERSSQGILAHFKDSDGNEHHLASHSHADKDIRAATARAGLKEIRAETVFGNDALAASRAKWKKYIGKPMIKIWEFQKQN